MSRNTHLLFELIRATIGKQTGLSKIPSSDEWQEFFDLSQKHAIAGVTFAGVRKLQQNGASIPSDVYWQWLGLTSQIQQRNEVMNAHCVEACNKLQKAGLGSSEFSFRTGERISSSENELYFPSES